MCEYCECRRIPEICRLGREHDGITELIDLLVVERFGSTRWHELRVALEVALAPHVEREEAGVFARIKQRGISDLFVDELEDDHKRFAAAMANGQGLDRESFDSLLSDIERHIAIEEYDVFPAAARRLTVSDWESIQDMGDEPDR